MTDLRMHVSARGRWRVLDADYYPALRGDDAREATALVIEGARLTLASGRRSGFVIAVPPSVAKVKPTGVGRRVLDFLAESDPRGGCLFVTMAPAEHADRIAAGFRAIDDRRRE